MWLERGGSLRIVTASPSKEWVNIDTLIPLEQQGVRFRPALAALSPSGQAAAASTADGSPVPVPPGFRSVASPRRSRLCPPDGAFL